MQQHKRHFPLTVVEVVALPAHQVLVDEDDQHRRRDVARPGGRVGDGLAGEAREDLGGGIRGAEVDPAGGVVALLGQGLCVLVMVGGIKERRRRGGVVRRGGGEGVFFRRESGAVEVDFLRSHPSPPSLSTPPPSPLSPILNPTGVG